VKRRELIRHVQQYGCELLRERWQSLDHLNRPAAKISSVPRHSEINEDLARKICKNVAIPLP
jgi:hypothetical protein